MADADAAALQPARTAGDPFSPRAHPTVVSIQYLRALAAILIVWHHAFSIPELARYYPKPYGQFGVDLFFVISGFIMWRTTAHGVGGALAFWRARIWRIVPLYWFYTTLFLAVAVVLPGVVSNASLDPLHIPKSYLFIPADHPRLGLPVPTYTLGWTLNYEMFFYLVFGACLLIPAATARFVAVAAVLCGLVALGRLLPMQGAVAQTYTSSMLLEFAGGVLLARMFAHGQTNQPLAGCALLAAGVIWLAIVYDEAATPDRFVAHGVPAMAMVAGGLFLEPLAAAHPLRLGLLLGDASYSIYLAHPFAARAWALVYLRAFGVASPAAFVVSTVVASLACGIASYLALERPVMKFARRARR